MYRKRRAFGRPQPKRFDDVLSIHSWFETGLSLESRTIVLESQSIDDEIDIAMSVHFIKCMTILESISNKDTITIILNSPGGDIHSSFAIYDRIIESPCPIIIRGYGSIMSGASIIIQAADIRQMSPSSYMMIHTGTVTLDNDMAKAKQWVKAYDDMSTMMYDIYFNACKKKNKKITKDLIASMCKDETILNSKQTLELGLIDSIYKGN